MSVSVNTNPYVRYVGTNSASEFTIPYPLFEASMIEAVIVKVSDETEQLLTESVHYTISGIEDLSPKLTLINGGQAWIVGGTGNLAPGYNIFIKHKDTAFQDQNFRDLGRWSPTVFNKVLDRFTMFLLAIRHGLSRSIQYSDYSTVVDGEVMTGEELEDRLTDLENVIDEVTGGTGGLGFDGYSARFGETFNTATTQETLAQILLLSYLGPQVSLSASGSGIYEKGFAITASTLTANVTRRTDLIASIVFKIGATTIATHAPPAQTGTGATVQPWTGSFSDTTTFSVEVMDDGAGGGPTTASSSATFTYVYPYYYGVGAPGLAAASVAGLTKNIIGSDSDVQYNFNITAGQVYYMAYPASYGALTSILDENGFETFGDWTLRTENITGLDATAQSYRIYEFDNPAGGSLSTFYRFIR